LILNPNLLILRNNAGNLTTDVCLNMSLVRVQTEFWMGREEQMVKLRYPDFMRLIPEDKRPYFETPLQNANPRIQIRGLTKVWLPMTRDLSV